MSNGSETDTIPELADQYHKARRNYGIFAALLLIWEFIGVDIPAGAEHSFLGFKFSLKSPAGAEIALILLILYFAFRLTIEWKQCDQKRRETLWSKLDFGFAHLLAIGAIAVYGYQSASGMQIFGIDALLALVPSLIFLFLAVILGFFMHVDKLMFKRPYGWRLIILFFLLISSLFFFIQAF